MAAQLLIRRRVVLDAESFAEIVVWRLPEPLPPSTHGFKYRLACVVRGQCVVRFDNERGKGDHVHIGDREDAYPFSTPEQLMRDFETAITRWQQSGGAP